MIAADPSCRLGDCFSSSRRTIRTSQTLTTEATTATPMRVFGGLMLHPLEGRYSLGPTDAADDYRYFALTPLHVIREVGDGLLTMPIRVLVSSVTAPPCASALPATVAPVVSVMLVCASRLPCSDEAIPRVEVERARQPGGRSKAVDARPERPAPQLVATHRDAAGHAGQEVVCRGEVDLSLSRDPIPRVDGPERRLRKGESRDRGPGAHPDVSGHAGRAGIRDGRAGQHDHVEQKRGDELPSGVLEMVKVYVATKRQLSVGDKMAGPASTA